MCLRGVTAPTGSATLLLDITLVVVGRFEDVAIFLEQSSGRSEKGNPANHSKLQHFDEALKMVGQAIAMRVRVACSLALLSQLLRSICPSPHLLSPVPPSLLPLSPSRLAVRPFSPELLKVRDPRLCIYSA